MVPPYAKPSGGKWAAKNSANPHVHVAVARIYLFMLRPMRVFNPSPRVELRHFIRAFNQLDIDVDR